MNLNKNKTNKKKFLGMESNHLHLIANIFNFRCRCQNGWYGTHCTRRTVDCLQSSSYELCGGHGACVHTNDANGYRCICDQGWISNGSTPACNQDINECESPTPHCSMDPEVVCINLPGTYTCGQCPHGNKKNYFQSEKLT